jgi:DDB1- and CUL4-associated factor 11
VASYSSNAYSGQFSAGNVDFIQVSLQYSSLVLADSSFFYTCCQDFNLNVYNTTVPPSRDRIDLTNQHHRTSMETMKTINGVSGRWTITDSHLSPDNERYVLLNIYRVLI